jgi:hypothetical protein
LLSPLAHVSREVNTKPVSILLLTKKSKLEKNNSKNVKLIIIFALFSDLNCVNNSQGPCFLSFGLIKVSKVPKISVICCFDIQSTKNKFKKLHINVNKWLKIVYKYYCDVFSYHLKPILNFLALKTTEIEAFENLNFFGSSSVCRRSKNIEEILSKVCRPADFSLEN